MSTPTQDKTLDTLLKMSLGTDPSAIASQAFGEIASLCQKFQIIELGLFGSVLRDDFRPKGDNPSDIDLIVFNPNHRPTWPITRALPEMRSFSAVVTEKGGLARR